MGLIRFLVQSVNLWTPNLPIDHNMSKPTVQFSQSWDVLAPFQIGTREASWGADPLEYHGGFSSLKPSSSATFPSALGKDGRARWSRFDAKSITSSGNASKAFLDINLPDAADWKFLQQVYGWAGMQWQGWMRGELTVQAKTEGEVTVLIYAENALEFVVDGKRYFGGDFFAYRRAPAVLKLKAGTHVVDVRLVRDVRAMGGVGEPSIQIKMEAKVARDEGLEIGEVLMPDVVAGKFASGFGSVTVTNSGEEWVDVEVSANDVQISSIDEPESQKAPLTRLAPGQTRPLVFHAALQDKALQEVFFTLASKSLQSGKTSSVNVTKKLIHASIYAPHKITYLHQSGIVSYSILRPPSKNATCSAGQQSAPIMLFLHGAGIDADNPAVKETLEAAPNLCAWSIFPSGVTSWCGDDWHTWGYMDVESTIAAVKVWTKDHAWEGIGVDTEKRLIGGHSNGGQGAWWALTHHPGKIIGGAPLSGYMSIPLYVPTTLWRPADPSKKAAVDFAIASYRNELLAANFAGIPIMQQHGGSDDNVPVYHSSLMYQLINETGTSSDYDVLEGKPHWWDGIATETNLQKFYNKVLANPRIPTLQEVEHFEIIAADPGEMSGRFGIRVLYLQEQGRLGKLKISRNKIRNTWRFVPENIMVMEIEADSGIGSVLIEDFSTPEDREFEKSGGKRVFRRQRESGVWTVSTDPAYPPTRALDQFGGLTAILRGPKQPFIIHAVNDMLFDLALQVSRNLNNYLAANTDIKTPSSGNRSTPNGHKITLALGSELPPVDFQFPEGVEFPVRVSPRNSSHLEFRSPSGRWRPAVPDQGEVGAIFLRPSKQHGLELVIWGSNLGLAEQAARLVPMITGTGQPDWILCQKEMKWKGLDGCEVGWFNAWWEIQE
ncbi:hypothetical protein BT63DRAFT_191683 [Microthyrium microscopicum]|uniref:Peptidase S9 prolyl oligopeptidase catalytic domain-containing protein n=1 Tax=Microthyrium microscopicum TaxID=703497 RepID=A0A6A6UKC0_9PEZI|nr:hypothetical protein BT63DRAFT_191683 [Microthyrium microscopicum]